MSEEDLNHELTKTEKFKEAVEREFSIYTRRNPDADSPVSRILDELDRRSRLIDDESFEATRTNIREILEIQSRNTRHIEELTRIIDRLDF